MNNYERSKLKQEKKAHKRALKNREVYINKRNYLVECILNSELPRFGSLKVSMVKI